MESAIQNDTTDPPQGTTPEIHIKSEFIEMPTDCLNNYCEYPLATQLQSTQYASSTVESKPLDLHYGVQIKEEPVDYHETDILHSFNTSNNTICNGYHLDKQIKMEFHEPEASFTPDINPQNIVAPIISNELELMPAKENLPGEISSKLLTSQTTCISQSSSSLVQCTKINYFLDGVSMRDKDIMSAKFQPYVKLLPINSLENVHDSAMNRVKIRETRGTINGFFEPDDGLLAQNSTEDGQSASDDNWSDDNVDEQDDVEDEEYFGELRFLTEVSNTIRNTVSKEPRRRMKTRNRKNYLTEESSSITSQSSVEPNIEDDPIKKKKLHKKGVCPICAKVFTQSGQCTRHIREVHGQNMKWYPCDICKKTFKRKESLKSHMRAHNGERPYSCDLCNKTYRQVAHLQEHVINSHTKEKKFICEICGIGCISSYKLRLHSFSHKARDLRPLKCEICNKGFISQFFLRTHMQSHTGERNFVCTTCGKAFRQKSGLVSHQKLHSGKKPYVCTLCDRAFTFSSNLRDHMLTHSDERPFSCTQCGKAFKSKKLLKGHHYTHAVEANFHCTICAKSFRTPKTLSSHMNSHEEYSVQCDICGKQFKSNRDVRNHIKAVHTSTRSFACRVCGQTFKTTSTTTQHMMKVHPIEEVERRRKGVDTAWILLSDPPSTS